MCAKFWTLSLVHGIVLSFIPDYFYFELLTRIIGIASLVLGVMGLGIEMNKLAGESADFGLSNLGLGLGFGVLWAVIYFRWPVWWVALLTYPLLILFLVGTAMGLMQLLKVLFSGQSSRRLKASQLGLVAAQLGGFILTVVQILSALKILKP